MKIEILNTIRDYIESPSLEVPSFDKIFSDDLYFVFFWREARRKMSLKVYEDIVEWNSNYFYDTVDQLIKGHNGNRNLPIIFVKSLLQSENRDSALISQIKKVIDYFIQNAKMKGTKIHDYLLFTDIILLLPINNIEDDYLYFISDVVLPIESSMASMAIEKEFVPKLLRDGKKKNLRITFEKFYFGYYEGTKPRSPLIDDKVVPKFDTFLLSELIKRDNIGGYLSIMQGEGLLTMLLGIIDDLVNKMPAKFTSLNIPSIEESSQNWDRESLAYLIVTCIRNVIDVYIPTEKFVENRLLKSHNTIVQRLGIYAINRNYESFRNLFWYNDEFVPVESNELKHEIYMLLYDNKDLLTAKELKVLFGWIDNMRIKMQSDSSDTDKTEKLRALIGKEYLHALLDANEDIKKKVLQKKRELDSIYKPERDHPGFNTFMSFSSGHDYPEENLEFEKYTSSSQALVKHLNKNRNEWSKIEKEAQASRVEKVFSRKPTLIHNYGSLLNLDLEFIARVIMGLEKAWKDRTQFNAFSSIQFIEEVCQGFNLSVDTEYSDIFVGNCAWLMREMTVNDTHAIEGDALEKAKDVCLSLLDLDIKNETFTNDPFFDVLNSTEGKLLDALLNISLRNARLKNANSTDRWYDDVRNRFTEMFNNGEYRYAQVHFVAGHLPQFGYLDLNWVKRNIDNIFPIENSKIWRIAMLSYLRLTPTLYKDLFMMLRPTHYKMGVDVFVGDEEGIYDFAQHVAISNITGWKGEGLEEYDSLINNVLQKSDTQQLIGVIQYVVRSKDYTEPQIKMLWHKVLNEVNPEKLEKEKVYKELLRLVRNIENIDSTFYELIQESLNSIKAKDNLFEFRREILKWNKSDIKFRAELLIKGSGNRLDDFYMQKEIEKMGQELYKTDKELANRFAKEMISKRLFNFLDIFNDNNNS